MNKIECHVPLTMGEDNYVYFVTRNGIPYDHESQILEKHKILPKVKNVQNGTANKN